MALAGVPGGEEQGLAGLGGGASADGIEYRAGKDGSAGWAATARLIPGTRAFSAHCRDP